MIRGSFIFKHDHHLVHITQADDFDFEVYRPYGSGSRWKVVNLDEELKVLPGEILLYRPVSLADGQCPKISALIRDIHHRLHSASPYERQVSIPKRYREGDEPPDYLAELAGYDDQFREE